MVNMIFIFQETVVLSYKSSPQKQKNYQPVTEITSAKKQKLNNIDKELRDQKTESQRSIINKNDNSDNSAQVKKVRAELKPKIDNGFVPKEIPVSNLWVDKYKPTNLKQLIGQQGDKSNVKKLLNWLQNWKKNHSGKTKLHRPSKCFIELK